MRGRWTWLALGLALVVAVGAAVLVPLVRGATLDEPAPTTSRQLLACAEMAPSDGYCQRLADDLAKRGPLTRIDRAEAERSVDDLRAAFTDDLGAHCPPDGQFCVLAGPPTAEAVRAALVAAGFSGPVRAARYTDPAPAGAIIYAVHAGAACLLGWIDESTGTRPQTVGRRPDGSCLAA